MQTVVVTEGETANLECSLLVGTEASQTITWIWTSTISNPNLNAAQNTNQSYSRLIINSTLQSYSGDYKCTALNEFGNYSRTIRLVVKSNNNYFFLQYLSKISINFNYSKGRLTPLWPFLGFLGEIALLLAILMFFEVMKRKNEKNLKNN